MNENIRKLPSCGRSAGSLRSLSVGCGWGGVVIVRFLWARAEPLGTVAIESENGGLGNAKSPPQVSVVHSYGENLLNGFAPFCIMFNLRHLFRSHTIFLLLCEKFMIL